jgi:hypothetical protein
MDAGSVQKCGLQRIPRWKSSGNTKRPGSGASQFTCCITTLPHDPRLAYDTHKLARRTLARLASYLLSHIMATTLLYITTANLLSPCHHIRRLPRHNESSAFDTRIIINGRTHHAHWIWFLGLASITLHSCSCTMVYLYFFSGRVGAKRAWCHAALSPTRHF